MKKTSLVALLFWSYSISAQNAYDSVLFYYLPLQSSFKTHVGLDEIKGQTDPFITTNKLLITSLQYILSDSLKKSSKYSGKAKSPFNPDVRIVIKFYSKDNSDMTYIITSGDNEFIEGRKIYTVSKVKFRSLLRFLFDNFTPQTDAQKHYFKILRTEQNKFPYIPSS
jgi:hypothetical protein